MNYAKTLGLAAMATAALLACIGSATASATVLCKGGGTGSPTGTSCSSAYSHAEIDGGNWGVWKLETTFKTVECSKSTIEIATENEGSATETVKGPVRSLRFEECNCEVSAITGGSAEIHWIEGTHNGTVTSSGMLFTMSCSTIIGTVHCIYSTNGTDLGVLKGGIVEKLEINASIPREVTSAACAEKATLKVAYTLSYPGIMYVAGHT